MYKHFFGLRDDPFGVNPDPRFLFLTPQTQKTLDDLTYGIQNRKGLILLTGEVGTGKTTLINRLLDWLHEQRTPTAFVFNSHLETSHLFDFIMADFGVPFDSRLNNNARMRLHQWLIERYLAGDTPVLIVDEAQGLPNRVLEEIRMLLNLETSSEKLLQIVLAGQPELEERLRQPELRQIKQRIALRCKTAALTLEETHNYIRTRLYLAGADADPIFASQAMDAVHFYSRGIPRVMNLLCEHALIHSCVEKIRPVPAHIIVEIAREFQFDDIKPAAPFLASPDSLDPSPITAQSPLMSALEALPSTARPIWNARQEPMTVQLPQPSAVAGSMSIAHEDHASLVSNRTQIPNGKGNAETFPQSSFHLRAPTALGLRQFEARLLSEWNAFFSSVGASLATGLAAKSASLEHSSHLHGVEVKRKSAGFPVLRGSWKSRTRKRVALASIANELKSALVSASWMKGTAARRVLTALRVRWRDHRSTASPSSWTRGIANLIQRWSHSLRQVSAWCWRSLARRESSFAVIRATDWPRIRASLYRWLRQPWDPTHWLQSDGRLFGQRNRLSHKKG
jgi:general secretion pathway protein A